MIRGIQAVHRNSRLRMDYSKHCHIFQSPWGTEFLVIQFIMSFIIMSFNMHIELLITIDAFEYIGIVVGNAIAGLWLCWSVRLISQVAILGGSNCKRVRNKDDQYDRYKLHVLVEDKAMAREDRSKKSLNLFSFSPVSALFLPVYNQLTSLSSLYSNWYHSIALATLFTQQGAIIGIVERLKTNKL